MYSADNTDINELPLLTINGLISVQFLDGNVLEGDFAAQDIRVVEILEAEKVNKTKKLLKLKVNTGVDTRTVISGIAEYYRPEDLVGTQVSILINLEPKKLRGIESQGMILCAENADGTLSIVSPDQKVKNGSEVK